jgi:hypothetical protein
MKGPRTVSCWLWPSWRYIGSKCTDCSILLAVRHCCIASLWNHHHTNPPPPSILNKFGCMPGLILLSTNLSYIAGSVFLEHVQESKSHSQIFILQSVHLLPMYLQDGHNQQDTVLGLFRMEGGGGFVWWWFHKLAMQQCLTARSQNPDFFNHCSTVKPNFNIHNSTKYLGFNSHCFLRGSSYECHKPPCLQV